MHGGGAEEEREIEMHPIKGGSMPHRRHMHIMREWCEVPTDEDEPGAGSGKHALGDANRSGLRHFAVACGADELDIDLFTSLDLRACIWWEQRRSVDSWPARTAGFACRRRSSCCRMSRWII